MIRGCLPCSVVVAVICALGVAPAFAQEPEPAVDPATTASLSTAGDANIFRKLFVMVVRDVKELSSADSRHILMNGATLAMAALPLDDVTTLGASSSTILKASFSGWGKALGREWVQGGTALATYVGGRLLNKPKMARVGSDLIEAQVFALTLTQGIKFASNRTRPDGEARSFPSGHASAAFATASVLQRRFGRKAAIPAYGMAVYTSMSRLQANSHFASDIMFGAALGVVAGRIATIEVAQSRLHVSALPTRRGVSIVVTPVAR